MAIGYELRERGVDFQIVDPHSDVGGAWRSRWDSLKLFTAAQYDELPGKSFPAPADTYPTKDEVADFLGTYATEFELPIRLDTEVTSLTMEGGNFVAETTTGEIEANHVVIATGPFQVPFIPPLASKLDPRVTQLHSAAYSNPDALADGKILIVGGANTGCQIALELSETRDVEISVGDRLPTVPQRPLNRDIWWWLTKLGITRITVDTRLGKRMSERDAVIGGGLKELRSRGVVVRPRVIAALNGGTRFEDGSSGEYDVVIWATGFRVDQSWIDVAGVKDEQGQIEHVRGVTSMPGLYLLGMSWQHKRTSALLGWVGEDAAYLADEIAARLRE